MAKRFTKGLESAMKTKRPHLTTPSQSQNNRAVAPSGPPAFLITTDPPTSEEDLTIEELRAKNHRLAVQVHSQKNTISSLKRRLDRRDVDLDSTFNYLQLVLRHFSMVEGRITSSSPSSSSTLSDVVNAAISNAKDVTAELEERCSSVSSKVQPIDGAADAVLARSEHTQSEAQKALDTKARLTAKVARLTRMYEQCSLKNEKQENEARRLRDHVNALLAEKNDKKDGQQDQQLPRLSSADGSNASSATKPSNSTSSSTSTPTPSSSTSAPDASNSNQAPDTVSISEQELEALKAQMKESRKQADALLAKVAHAEKEALDARQALVSDVHLQRQPYVQGLQQRNKTLAEQLALVEQDKQGLARELAASETARLSEITRFREKVAEVQASATERLKAIEDELVSAKGECIRLQASNPSSDDAKKAGGTQFQRSLKEAEDMIAVLTTQLSQARAQNSRAPTDTTPPQTAEDLLSSGKSADAVINDLLRKIASYKANEAALIEEVDSTGQSFDELQDQNERLLKELKDKEARDLRHLEERIKASQVCSNLMEEKKQLQRELDAKFKQREAEHQHYLRLAKGEGRLLSQFEEVSKELRQVKTEHESARLALVTHEQQLATERSLLAQARQAKGELETALSAARSDLTKTASSANTLKSEVKGLNAKLALAAKGSPDEILEEQMKELQNKLLCSACRVREKNTIMLKCYHMFCEECVMKRVQTRQRKCPQCFTPFDKGNFHRAYF